MEVCGKCYASKIITEAISDSTEEKSKKPEWIPGDCESCGYNEGKCYGHCIWDEHLEFDPYEAIMILVERGKEQAK